MQLSGKTLGIVGYGRIGQQIYNYANAFCMCVKVYDDWDEPTEYFELIQSSDIITIHVPLNDFTKGMIGEKEFELMKHGALLVNTSRAGIVDEKAVNKALNNNKILYAHDFADDYYSFAMREIGTPHISGDCIEARRLTDIYIAKKIKEYVKGGQRTQCQR
jgi:phosphoglycerate dehydrogenase-like enzyme